MWRDQGHWMIQECSLSNRKDVHKALQYEAIPSYIVILYHTHVLLSTGSWWFMRIHILYTHNWLSASWGTTGQRNYTKSAEDNTSWQLIFFNCWFWYHKADGVIWYMPRIPRRFDYSDYSTDCIGIMMMRNLAFPSLPNLLDISESTSSRHPCTQKNMLELPSCIRSLAISSGCPAKPKAGKHYSQEVMRIQYSDTLGSLASPSSYSKVHVSGPGSFPWPMIPDVYTVRCRVWGLFLMSSW